MRAPSLTVALLALGPATTRAGEATTVDGYTADGRASYAQLSQRYQSLATEHGWVQETIYAYPDDPDLAIRAWRTQARGEALWIIAGIHGEEPAGPNAIASNLTTLVQLAKDGVPMVVIPLANPKAYRSNRLLPGIRQSLTGARVATASATPSTCCPTSIRAPSLAPRRPPAPRRRRSRSTCCN